MGDLTKNISRHEVLCKCGKCDFAIEEGSEILNVVQETTDHFKARSLVIHSAARCTEYNRLPIKDGGPGSNDKSQHPRCTAIDFHLSGISLETIYLYLTTRYPTKFGIGIYNSFIHLDVRPSVARWDKRA